MAWRCLRLLLVMFLAMSGTYGAKARAETGTELVQEKKKRKKHKKKRKKPMEDGSEAPAAEGEEKPAEGAAPTVHAKQEGVDAPYKWQISLLSDFAVNNETVGEAKTGSADYTLNGKAGYIIASSVILGLGLDYNESSFKTEDATNTSSDYLLRFFGDYVFGDLDKDQMAFFIEAGFGVGSSKSTVGDATSKGSKTALGVGFGIYYFVDSNVAFTAQFLYDTGSRKVDGQDEPTKFTSMHIARLGFSLFL